MARNSSSSRLVYSTANNSECPRCHKPLRSCTCQPAKSPSPADAVIRVSRQTKGRKGKGVTLITGVPLQGEALKVYAGELKKLCATGGAVKGEIIEMQGDHRDRVIELIKKRGWQVKRSGG